MYLEVGAFLPPWDTLNLGFIVGILSLSGCLLVWGMCSQCLMKGREAAPLAPEGASSTPS